MKSLIYRVGADSTPAGGETHGRLNDNSYFTYLPIPERYDSVSTPKYKEHPMKEDIPKDLLDRSIHLDPNFEKGTYGNIYVFCNGNKNPKGQRLLEFKENIPFRLVFFSALKDKDGDIRYGFIGQLIATEVEKVNRLGDDQKKKNVHGQRKNGKGDGRSVIAFAEEGDLHSGRYDKFIEFADYRNKSYRVKQNLLKRWGGWSSNDGHCQLGGPWTPWDHEKFEKWLGNTLDDYDIEIVPKNW